MSATDPKTTGSPAAATVDGFSAADTSDIATMSYEQARSELVETVSRLEAGGAGLEESLALWERGEALADRCEAWLDGARARLHEVRAKVAGTGPDAGSGTGPETGAGPDVG
ncbi:exodeoxyribonuclease VII small subunit [Citricoccus sp. NPDC055426]|uniref:exodeoxyribonuclease VII small subunit n=1 Tax=Citricoccus sp. NPDC055426 TaxID=3155536 RepID=UPI0034188B97